MVNMLAGEQERLSATFAALADPTRRAILARLARGTATVLERAELIERGRRGPGRPCRLRSDRLRDAEQWMAGQREFWEAGFDRLADRLDRISDEEAR
jgi:DNA-binding transcriptional ArsR family regulator